MINHNGPGQYWSDMNGKMKMKWKWIKNEFIYELEYAYNLWSFRFPNGFLGCTAMSPFFCANVISFWFAYLCSARFNELSYRWPAVGSNHFVITHNTMYARLIVVSLICIPPASYIVCQITKLPIDISIIPPAPPSMSHMYLLLFYNFFIRELLPSYLTHPFISRNAYSVISFQPALHPSLESVQSTRRDNGAHLKLHSFTESFPLAFTINTVRSIV